MKDAPELKTNLGKYSMEKKGQKNPNKTDESRPSYSLEKKAFNGSMSKEVNQPKGYES